MGKGIAEKERPENYDFTTERQDLIAMIAYEYGMLCQATGQYDDQISTLHRMVDAAMNYGFVINNPDDEYWSIDTGKARNFAEMKAKEIHDELFK